MINKQAYLIEYKSLDNGVFQKGNTQGVDGYIVVL